MAAGHDDTVVMAVEGRGRRFGLSQKASLDSGAGLAFHYGHRRADFEFLTGFPFDRQGRQRAAYLTWYRACRRVGLELATWMAKKRTRSSRGLAGADVVATFIAEQIAGSVVIGAEGASTLLFFVRECGCGEEEGKVGADVDEVVGRKRRSKELARPAQQAKALRPPPTDLSPREARPASRSFIAVQLEREVASKSSFEEKG